MSIEIFNKLSNGNRKFAENNGKTYKEYIAKNCNLSTGLKYQILQSKTDIDALNIIKRNNIQYTHNYFDSKIIDEPNIELEINYK